MIRFEFGKSAAKPPVIDGGPVVLRAADASDYQAWFALREESREHLTRWEPEWCDAETTADSFRARLRLYNRQRRAGVGLSLFVRLKIGDRLVGGASLSDIRAHASHSATLGYWIGAPHLRQGLGVAAVAALTRHAFEAIGLNRIEAACQPGNVASRALLAKVGFRQEGFARDYLYINGAWRDHLLFALTARDYCGAPYDPLAVVLGD
jgi:ribosomal-protein-alanine N-acetyltransferase